MFCSKGLNSLQEIFKCLRAKKEEILSKGLMNGVIPLMLILFGEGQHLHVHILHFSAEFEQQDTFRNLQDGKCSFSKIKIDKREKERQIYQCYIA